ncbi:hypothetical protein [Veillonella seminalis]|uniref:Uncharacterized protein n=1 Tax=Veillonella seminalis ACS-216-V-Col6b TaxID=883156 RepID=K9D581_9FIRM|nr:hypothetical protein [Veillonella seminalis]EKU78336.1 hypothetical protein HMPREF9282_01242 [Veillonella seminalis ACS-216-V-Col6b]
MILIDTSEIKELEKKLENIPNGAIKVLRRTINETANRSGKAVSDTIKDNYNYIGKVGLIKKAIKVTKPDSGEDISATINVTSGAQPLRDFAHSPKKKTFGRGRILSANVKNGGKALPGAFKTVMTNGHIGIYKRLPGQYMKRVNKIGVFKGMQRRAAIDQLFGPSIAAMAGSDESRETIEENIKDTFTKRLDHNVEQILAGDK